MGTELRKGIKVVTKDPNDIWHIADGTYWTEYDQTIAVLTPSGEPLALFSKSSVIAIGYTEELK